MVERKNSETKMKKDKLSANIMINRVLFVNYYRLPIYKWRKKVKHYKKYRKLQNVDVVAKRYQKLKTLCASIQKRKIKMTQKKKQRKNSYYKKEPNLSE